MNFKTEHQENQVFFNPRKNKIKIRECFCKKFNNVKILAFNSIHLWNNGIKKFDVLKNSHREKLNEKEVEKSGRMDIGMSQEVPKSRCIFEITLMD